MTAQYILGQSIFVYDVYYTLNDSQTDKEKIDKMLMRDFYQLIKDEIQDIYSQSHIS
ncbi:MAG: hypothetical protein ACLUVC_13720 [Longibaculum sp.]